MIDLSHLRQTTTDFDWRSPTGKQTYRVWLRYSTHCYSRELGEGETLGESDHVVETHPRLRVYCPERYGQTGRLVIMIRGLFEKPTSKVSLTRERNWTTFTFYEHSEGGGQHRYCAFFRIRNSARQLEDPSLHSLEMYVESAYVRSDMVRTLRSCPFGLVAHMTRYRIPYF
ncbi:hypothetical protein [Aquibium microcysteis]|uniref:hypothetical protein n=1 Tax=Aquibium microcysteis TaxID=675281 RepID=UPI00165D21BB|nr:hypothetical protein [Aquibium microcysteis]